MVGDARPSLWLPVGDRHRAETWADWTMAFPESIDNTMRRNPLEPE